MTNALDIQVFAGKAKATILIAPTMAIEFHEQLSNCTAQTEKPRLYRPNVFTP